MFQLLVINATGKEWDTWKKRAWHLADIWGLSPTAPSISISYERRDVGIPTVDNEGRVDRTWFDKNLSAQARALGFNAVMCIFSPAQAKKYGIKPNLRGHYIRDNDFIGELWVVADEKTIYTYPSGKKVVRFDKTAAHELSHMVAHDLNVADRTHEYEEKFESVERCFEEYDWTKWKNLYSLYLEKKTQFANMLKGKPSTLHPVVKAKAERVVKDMALAGFGVTVFQGFRSFAEQDALYAQGRTKPGAIVTNAKGGESYHNYGLAVDIVFVQNGKPSWDQKHPWALLGKIGKAHGFYWGGDWQFKDLPHLQYTNFSIEQLQNNKVDYTQIV